MILAIARGGLLVAGALGYALGVKNTWTMNVEFYTGVDQRLDLPMILPPVPDLVDLEHARVLIADDVADTGLTLQTVHDFCGERVGEVRSAVLYEKSRSVVQVRLRVAPHRQLDRVPVERPAARRRGRDHRGLAPHPHLAPRSARRPATCRGRAGRRARPRRRARAARATSSSQGERRTSESRAIGMGARSADAVARRQRRGNSLCSVASCWFGEHGGDTDASQGLGPTTSYGWLLGPPGDRGARLPSGAADALRALGDAMTVWDSGPRRGLDDPRDLHVLGPVHRPRPHGRHRHRHARDGPRITDPAPIPPR